MLVKAPAKVNLILKVTGRRPDGYHELFTLMVPVALCDNIYMKAGQKAAPGIALRCTGKKIPTDERNLIWRACEAFYAEIENEPRVDVLLQKAIPVAAGLGGGSSDAGAVLRALNKIYGNPLQQNKLWEIARGLGADVPFFLQEDPCIGTGIGDVLDPLEEFPQFWYLIATPPIAISTSWVYSEFRLTQPPENYILKLQERLWVDEALELENDLEKVVLPRFPEVAQIKCKMLELGAIASVMSGSGPSVVGLFRDRDKANEAFRGIAQGLEGEAFLVRQWEGSR